MRSMNLLLLFGLLATGCGSKPSAPIPEVRQARSPAAPDEAADKPLPDFKPKFTIGKETTYVLGPLDDHGYIDYIAALNERLREGVTPDNNAVVLLCQALGPHPEGATMPAEFYEWLQIPPPPEKGEYFVSTFQFLRSQIDVVDANTLSVFEGELERAAKSPWKADLCPQVASWLKANEKPLAVVIEATHRSHFFYPMVPKKRDAGLMHSLIPHLQLSRLLVPALLARAMLSVEEGRLDDAWRDLLACHRLARLLGYGGSLIGSLIGFATNTLTCDADLVFIERANANAELLRKSLRDLEALPPVPPLADHMDLVERLFFLDAVVKVGRNGMGYLELGMSKQTERPPDEITRLLWESMNWDPALRAGNQWYDRLASAMRAVDRSERESQLEKLDEEHQALKEAVKERGFAEAVVTALGTPEAQGKFMADLMIQLMIPGFRKVQTAADRAEQTQRNLHLALALAIYRREHGRYPAKLNDLAPKYLAEMPLDLFTGEPLVYRLSEKGYLLYSLGPNGQDDQGRTKDDKPAGDDLSVRIPLSRPE